VPEKAQMSDHLLVNHCRLITNDLDEARDYVGRLWERHDSHLRRGRKYGIRWHQADLVHVSLSYVQNFSALHVQCGPVRNVFHFTMHESGRVQRFTNGRESVSTPSRAALHAPGQELRLEMEPFRLLILTLDGDIVAKALAARFTRGLPVENWPTEFPIQSPPVGALQSLTRWMARELDRPGTALLHSPRTTASLERALLALFLECLQAHLPETEPAPGDLAACQLKRLEEWLDHNFAEPIGAEDMAKVAGVSVRTVQNAFRRFRGCTPTEALVGRRLDYARRMLRHAPPGTTVTQVAMDCGFFHLGRFSGRYAQVFGERPSETLAQSRSA
jgi:AraC-like DNA-binding protein